MADELKTLFAGRRWLGKIARMACMSLAQSVCGQEDFDSHCGSCSGPAPNSLFRRDLEVNNWLSQNDYSGGTETCRKGYRQESEQMGERRVV